MRSFWPICETAQCDYELLRTAVMEGRELCDEIAARFQSSGLAGLIEHPCGQPRYELELVSASRPPWTPYCDPREQTLAICYEYLLVVVEGADILAEEIA